MKVIDIVENENGSVLVTVDLTKGEVALLLENSIIRAMENYIKESNDALDTGQTTDSK